VSQDNTDLAELTPGEMRFAEALLDSALAWRAVPVYSSQERLVLAILAADLSRQQRIRGAKSKNAAKLEAEYRRLRVNLLLRYVVPQACRDDPTCLKSVMTILDWLDTACGIEATEAQVRRDIRAVLKLGPLSKP
jgi:hypothetical protein